MADKSMQASISAEFEEAISRQSLNSGENITLLFGKIKKWLTDLEPIAFSGDYSDLSNTPTIPSVGDGTITIKQAGTVIGSFTTNQSDDTTLELTDSNTWRPVQDNLTSTSATDSLSANQGKVLKELADSKIPLIIGTQTSSTGSWTGITDKITSLYEGLTILYWLPYAGSGAATLNLTLKDGSTTGAINCYYTGATRITTHIPANNVMMLTYQTVTISGNSYTGWWLLKTYDSSNYTTLRNENGRIYAGTNGIWRYTLVALDNNNQYQSFVTSSSTATSKTINTSAKFKLPAIIYYYGTGNDASSGKLVSSTYAVYERFPNLDLRYSTNCTTTSFTAHSPIYLECTIDEDGYFSPTTNCITQTLTSGRYYIYLGQTYSTSYQLTLTTSHPCYYYDGTNLTDCSESLYAKKSHTHDYSKVTLSRSLTSGTKIGTISIDGTSTDLYCQTNTDTKVTAVGNHYTPSGGTTISASGGTLTDITNSSSGVQVVTGVTKDAAGHVTGVTSVALKSVNTTKNPYALTIQGNGTTLTNGIYDGSAAKTVNITPSSIGAAASSHTHSYLPLSGGTVTGNINAGDKDATTAKGFYVMDAAGVGRTGVTYNPSTGQYLIAAGGCTDADGNAINTTVQIGSSHTTTVTVRGKLKANNFITGTKTIILSSAVSRYASVQLTSTDLGFTPTANTSILVSVRKSSTPAPLYLNVYTILYSSTIYLCISNGASSNTNVPTGTYYIDYIVTNNA